MDRVGDKPGIVHMVGGVLVCFAAAMPVAAPAQEKPVLRPPPPAPIVRVPAPAPSPTAEEIARIKAARDEIVALDMDVTAHGERLWSGTLRVNASEGRYTASRSDFSGTCGDAAAAATRPKFDKDSLSVSARRSASGTELDLFTLSANWQRPDAQCQGLNGLRTSAIISTVRIAPGETIELEGDGGLRIRVKRGR
jgi:hypothetical protein